MPKIALRSEYKSIIEGFGLVCPQSNPTAQRVIRFIHAGSTQIRLLTQVERIAFLKNAEEVWLNKAFWQRNERRNRYGKVCAIVPASDDEILEDKLRQEGFKTSIPVSLVRLEMKWDDHTTSCIKPPQKLLVMPRESP